MTYDLAIPKLLEAWIFTLPPFERGRVAGCLQEIRHNPHPDGVTRIMLPNLPPAQIKNIQMLCGGYEFRYRFSDSQPQTVFIITIYSGA